MWIVRLALRRPYSVAVFAALIFIAGILSIQTMLVDIFPKIDIPVVGIVWAYPGLPAEDMERRVVLIHERAISTTVGGISKIESESIPGIGLLRVYFQPSVDIASAVANISAVSQTVLRILPPGITPPNIVQYNASNVPVIQVTMSSDTLPEEQIFDYALNFIRIKLFTIPGLSTPAPYGGKTRQINIDVSPDRLLSKGLSPQDVVNAVQASNLILPAGTTRIGDLEYKVLLNSSPSLVEQFNDLPVKIVNNQPITVGDVAKVADSFADQTNLVRINGRRAAYLSILKKEDASTLDVINAVKKALPDIQAGSPEGLKLKLDFDQSIFVKGAIWSVLREAGISSFLVALMILFFLGSWRSVIVVCTSIPLAILSSIVGLKLTGNSINIMTLGGLSLAIGMLVDDATVEIENINRNRATGLPLTRAILTGASQIALPAIMATLSICVVFFPVELLTGPAKYLFTPMALSVVFAMLMSYLLSRTLVPLLSRMLLEHEEAPKDEHENRMFPRIGKLFEGMQNRYNHVLHLFMDHRGFIGMLAVGVLIISLILPFFAKEDFFPQVDTGLLKLRVRAPSGTRIETMENYVERVENIIKKEIPPEQVQSISSNIGIPTSYNLAFIPTDNIGGMDAEILVSLQEKHDATNKFQKKIREELNANFPGFTFYFQPADIVNQVLNFGLTAPIDVQIEGKNLNQMVPIAQKLYAEMKGIPGAVDVNIKQVFDYPTLNLNVDRVRAGALGVTQRDIANSMLVALSSSSLVAPSYFLNPTNNVNYSVVVKAPLPQMSTVNDLLSMPVTPDSGGKVNPSSGTADLSARPALGAERLGNLATLTSSSTLNEINHENVQRVLNITANLQDRDLGGVVDDIQEKVKGLGKLPQDIKVTVRGQGETMHESFTKLGLGIILSIVLVYLLMVILFQSFLDPFIVMVAIPGALVGVLWMLTITGTSINVESLMGTIMAVGIAASNSILLVSFANDARVGDKDGKGNDQNKSKDKGKDQKKAKTSGDEKKAESKNSDDSQKKEGQPDEVFPLKDDEENAHLNPILEKSNDHHDDVKYKARDSSSTPGDEKSSDDKKQKEVFPLSDEKDHESEFNPILGKESDSDKNDKKADPKKSKTDEKDSKNKNGEGEEKMSAEEAALSAGKTRLRPVLMTATAMILGMAPAALGLGEGGEQNAPLGRAVIGGLLVATGVTLFIVPLVYAVLRKEMPQKHLLDERLEQESHEGEENDGNNGDQKDPQQSEKHGEKSPAEAP